MGRARTGLGLGLALCVAACQVSSAQGNWHAKAGHRTRSAASDPNSKRVALGDATIAGVSVAGLTPEEARKRVASALDGRLNAVITLTDGKRYQKRKMRELGVGLDAPRMVARAKDGAGAVPLLVRVNRTVLQKAIRHVAPAFGKPARDARLVVRHGRPRVIPGADGRVVDVGASAVQVERRLKAHPVAGTVRLVIHRHAPAVTTAMLRRVTGPLARFTTRFNARQAKRSHNIRLAAQQIDGTLLMPGQVFSLNQTVGQRNHQNGFLTAPVFENKKEVPGVGGGVSQVTGTLFNAALMAGLPIKEYRTHSRPVAYLPIGRDATVAWRQFDMRFANNTKAPIYVAMAAKSGRLTAALYGARDPRQRVSVAVRARRLAPNHIVAELYRTVKRGGQVVRKERVGHSDYTWVMQASR